VTNKILLYKTFKNLTNPKRFKRRA